MKNTSKILPLTSLVLAIFVLSACSTQRLYISGDKDITSANKSETQIFFIGGIGQSKTIDSARTCGGADKVAAVEFQYGVLDWLVSVLTWNIISPRTVKVYCKY